MSLRIVIGPMFAGKTSEIQSIVRRYGSLGKQVLVLTAEIDRRYSDDAAIVNHDRLSIPARSVALDRLLDVLEWPAFAAATSVVVDEAQFFRGCLIPFVQKAVDEHGKHLVVVGLDSDADRRPFGDILSLIALADTVEKKTALCKYCGDGSPAVFTRRLASASASASASDHGSQVAVGGAESYEPVCRRHFLRLSAKPTFEFPVIHDSWAC